MQAFVRFVERIPEVHSIERETSRRTYVCRRRLTKIQTTTIPDHVWQKYGRKSVKPIRIEKNKKPQLDNARRLRGIYFLDADDQDDKEILKNCEEKLERSMAATMPCKRKAQIAPRKWLQSMSQNDLWLKSGIS